MSAREAQARYRQTDKGKATARRYAKSERGHARLRRVNQRRLDDPRNQARKAVQNAVRDGRLVKSPCWCGESVVDGHHANGYEGEHRLEVVWLCRPHHREVHQERRTLIRRRADSALAGRLQGRVSRFAGEVVESCPIPECDLFGAHDLHRDSEGFEWRQHPREAAEDRTDWAAKQP